MEAGECAAMGFTEMVEKKDVQPAGSPMKMSVVIMAKGAAGLWTSQIVNVASGCVVWVAGQRPASWPEAGFLSPVLKKSIEIWSK